MKVRLDAIVFDAGTQIREALDAHVVTDYAEAMTTGATFPPIVLFHDGTQHYLADGFHRFMAAQRNQFREIDSDVRAGTKEDALWFALGANAMHGKQLTRRDVRHAVILARKTWPDMLQTKIAEQVGCSQQRVSQVLGESVPVTTPSRHTKLAPEKASRIEEMLKAGTGVEEIARTLKTGKHTIAKVRADCGIDNQYDRTRAGVEKRRERMREMATEGYTSRQIAADVGMTEEGCRGVLKAEGIDVQADRAVGPIKRHDSNRIVEQIVMDAENLIEGVNLINYSALDRERLGDWADALVASKKALDVFIRRLIKEKQKHVEAA